MGVHTFRMIHDGYTPEDGDRMIVATDAENGYGNISRNTMLNSLGAICPKMLPFVLATYGDESPLVWKGDVIRCVEGIIQGDPLSTGLYDLAAKRVIDEVRGLHPTINFLAFLDDFFLEGPSEEVYSAERTLKDVGAKHGYILNQAKGQRVRNPRHTLTEAELAMHVAELQAIGGPSGPINTPIVDGNPRFKDTLIVLGAPVGPAASSRAILMELVKAAVEGIESLEALSNNQIAFLLLQKCKALPALNYLMRVVPPSHFVLEDGTSMLAPFDEAKHASLAKRLSNSKEATATQVPDLIKARSKLAMGKRGGLGLRDTRDLSAACFIASTQDTLAEVLARTDSFGKRSVDIHAASDSHSLAAWTTYDDIVKHAPPAEEDRYDDDGKEYPAIFRTCAEYIALSSQSEHLQPSTKTQRRLTKRIDRAVARTASLTSPGQGGLPHGTLAYSMDSRYLTGIPGTLGVVSLSNEEHSLALQRTLGAEEFFALAGTRTNRCGTGQPLADHSLPSCGRGPTVMTRHNMTNQGLAHFLNQTELHGVCSDRLSKSVRIAMDDGTFLEPADVFAAAFMGDPTRPVAIDSTFVDPSATSHARKTLTDLFLERTQEKIDKYQEVCDRNNMMFLPLVYTVDGFCSRGTAENLLYLFGIDVSDEIKGPELCRHLFMTAGRCPKGLGTEQYQRITLLKGYLRHLSGVCAKTAAWALNGHMVPGKSALPGRMGAEWDLRTGEELVRT